MEVLLKTHCICMESPPWSSEQKAEAQHLVSGPLLPRSSMDRSCEDSSRDHFYTILSCRPFALALKPLNLITTYWAELLLMSIVLAFCHAVEKPPQVAPIPAFPDSSLTIILPQETLSNARLAFAWLCIFDFHIVRVCVCVHTHTYTHTHTHTHHSPKPIHHCYWPHFKCPLSASRAPPSLSVILIVLYRELLLFLLLNHHLFKGREQAWPTITAPT